MKRSILLSILLCAGFQIFAQQIDVDTTKNISYPASQDVEHSPKKATLYSAILPGLGQAYNKKYWKIPIIYIGFGAFGYFIDWHNNNYKISKTAYQHLTDDNPDTNDFLLLEAVKGYDLENATSLQNFKDGLIKRQDYYRRNRDFLVILTVGFYGLNIIDASVDAHLFDFDLSDDLTMNWQPSAFPIDNQLGYCINVSFNF